MSDYYFEFNDYVLEHDRNLKGKYMHINSRDRRRRLRPTMMADRVWREENGKVYWYKNRYGYKRASLELNTKELEEFIWIKLSAHNAP